MKCSRVFEQLSGPPRWEIAAEYLCEAGKNGFCPASMLVALWILETEAIALWRSTCPKDFVGLLMSDLAFAEAAFRMASGDGMGTTKTRTRETTGLSRLRC